MIRNFGENVTFSPASVCRPSNEAELMEALRLFAARRVRVMGRLHSWSPAAATDSVLVDLSRFDSVQVVDDGGIAIVRAGAGAQLKSIARELHRQGLALPSMGLIDEQSIAGAIATATHGSGKHSLSHYVRAVRVVQFAEEGRPVVRTIDCGPALRAARCNIGCMGIVTSVDLEIRKQYLIEEQFRRYPSLEQVLACENEWPLQQFYLLPWRWTFIAQHRREVSGDRQRRRFARLFAVWFHLVFDIGMHWLILAAIRVVRRPSFTKFLFRHVLPQFVICNWRVVDWSQRILTMQHELFRHIEIEMFVPRSKLDDMLQWTRWLLEVASGERAKVPETVGELCPDSILAEAESLRGRYTHHYPICVRRVLPDDTLVSMTAGWNEPGYAVSLICYLPPNSREGFEEFSRLLARGSIAMFGARAHWGKFHDIDARELLANVPGWGEFCAQARAADPAGVTRNEWARQLFEAGSAS